MAKVGRDQSRTLCSLSAYEQRLTRQFDKSLKEVQELQAKRLYQEQLASGTRPISCKCIKTK